MLTLSNIIVRLLEGIAITAVIYLVTKRTLITREVIILAVSITLTFMVLDLFAPAVGVGARQGSGFGLGYMQVAGDGNTMPRHYYGGSEAPSQEGGLVEGMDDPVALDYYGKYNPNSPHSKPEVAGQPNMVINKVNDESSIILQEYEKNPFKTTEQYAPYPN